MLVLRGLAVAPPLVLAPMAGLTDRDFRLLIRRLGGCGLVCTEFISAEGLLRGNPATLRMLQFAAEERPLAVQIYGGDPGRMAEAARAVAEAGADVCDINMGCPAHKVMKGCAGAALLGDLPRARAVLQAVRKAVSIPLTVKLRLGLRADALTYVELGRIVEGEGGDGVALHARTASQQYAGRADWEHIARLKQALTIPVVGNGDVRCAEDAVQMLRRTGCDGVMIGRASLANPWIFRESAALLAGRRCPPASREERGRLLLQHAREVVAREDPRTALHRLKTLTGWFTIGLPDGRHLRRQLGELTSPAALVAAVEAFFAAPTAAPSSPASPGRTHLPPCEDTAA